MLSRTSKSRRRKKKVNSAAAPAAAAQKGGGGGIKLMRRCLDPRLTVDDVLASSESAANCARLVIVRELIADMLDKVTYPYRYHPPYPNLTYLLNYLLSSGTVPAAADYFFEKYILSLSLHRLATAL